MSTEDDAQSTGHRRLAGLPVVVVLVVLAVLALAYSLVHDDGPIGAHSGSSAQTEHATQHPQDVSDARRLTDTGAPNTANKQVRECDPAEPSSEAYDVIDTIYAGGPFEYPDNDGKRFGNYEGELPDEPRGYYREYTVSTPGLNHRGERRIVTGGDDPDQPEVIYYTWDHYDSFCEVPADE